MGAMELGDYLASLRACGRAEVICGQLRTEILQLLREEHQDEIDAHQKELAEIRGAMPRKGGTFK
jgi:hypothetical protein